MQHATEENGQLTIFHHYCQIFQYFLMIRSQNASEKVILNKFIHKNKHSRTINHSIQAK